MANYGQSLSGVERLCQDVLAFFGRKPGMASGARIELHSSRTPLHVWPVFTAAVVATSLALSGKLASMLPGTIGKSARKGKV